TGTRLELILRRALRAGCKISSLAGGRERGRPAGRGAVSRDECFSGEHPVGLFADRTRLELILPTCSSLARGWPRTGRPAGRGAVSRDECFSGEHPVGLFADRTRLELILPTCSSLAR